MIEVTPFSYIFVLYILFITIKKGINLSLVINLFFISLVFDITMLRGFMIRISDKEYYYENFFTIYAGFINLLYILKNKVNLKTIRIFFIFLLCFTLSIIYEYYSPLSVDILTPSTQGGWDSYVAGDVHKQQAQVNFLRAFLIFCQAFYFFTSCLIVKNNYRFFTIESIFKKTTFCCKLIVFSVFIEIISKFVFKSSCFNDLLGYFFGDGFNTYSFDDMRDNKYILQGLTREPSHLAFSLFLCQVYLWIDFTKTRKNITFLFIISSVLLSYFSGAFSFILYFVCFLFFILIFKLLYKKNILFKGFFVLLLFSTTVFFIYILIYPLLSSSIVDRLTNIENSFFYILQDDWKGRLELKSEYARLISIVDNFYDFLHRPILGLGAGVELSHSGIVTFLSNVGLLCFILWIYVLSHISNNFKISCTLLFTLVVLPNLIIGFYSTLLSVNTIFLVSVQFLHSEYLKKLSIAKTSDSIR